MGLTGVLQVLCNSPHTVVPAFVYSVRGPFTQTVFSLELSKNEAASLLPPTLHFLAGVGCWRLELVVPVVKFHSSKSIPTQITFRKL